ncbi:hypothetical protein J2752_000442 [Halarchaeum rubridurum]|uniref:Uncharacterized protein n=1 Tax=Halarchaeum rubridurum TaxID=489911 RepID=A0A830FZ39_9EURY|nr:hypothetical protein [Halarchaeum rubridurum]MBP1953561.1 hypothetical protein [Halarchaeum rubridurum]GGM64374.1 hypothetical protein GCM10009017_13000 [Halarchaeum rubridurum]
MKIHPDAPTDADGNPVHPDDADRYICGRPKSESTTPSEHGRERDDVDFCMLTAGHGTTDPKRTGEPGVACKHHGGNAPKGRANGNYQTGAFSEHLQSDLSDREREAFGGLVEAFGDQDRAQDAVRELAAEALIKYKRSGDHRFLREARQLLSEFNIADATDHLEVDGVDDLLMQDLREAHDE